MPRCSPLMPRRPTTVHQLHKGTPLFPARPLRRRMAVYSHRSRGQTPRLPGRAWCHRRRSRRRLCEESHSQFSPVPRSWRGGLDILPSLEYWTDTSRHRRGSAAGSQSRGCVCCQSQTHAYLSSLRIETGAAQMSRRGRVRFWMLRGALSPSPATPTVGSHYNSLFAPALVASAWSVLLYESEITNQNVGGWLGAYLALDPAHANVVGGICKSAISQARADRPQTSEIAHVHQIVAYASRTITSAFTGVGRPRSCSHQRDYAA
jgi:hypothetical protein